jgi:hypothetical protein
MTKDELIKTLKELDVPGTTPVKIGVVDEITLIEIWQRMNGEQVIAIFSEE